MMISVGANFSMPAVAWIPIMMIMFTSPPSVTLVNSWMMVPTITTTTTISKATATTTISSSSRLRMATDDNSEEFASFAATLDDDYNSSKTTNTKASRKVSTTSSKSSSATSKWQKDLDTLIFDRTTTIAQRQILISDLFSANNEIRQSFTTAIRDRTVRCWWRAGVADVVSRVFGLAVDVWSFIIILSGSTCTHTHTY